MRATILVLTLVSIAAYAESKIERKKHESDLMQEAVKEMQEACGCAGPKWVVDWESYKKATDMEFISKPARDLASLKRMLCSSEMKVAWCKWSGAIVYKIHMVDGDKMSIVKSKDGKAYDCSTVRYEEGAAKCDGNEIADDFRNAN